MSKKNPSKYYYAVDDERLGPVSGAELKKLAADGTLLPDATVWKEGTEKGLVAGKVRGLFPASQNTKPEPKKSERRSGTKLTQRRIFVSCVTHEFRAYRDQLATRLAQPALELRRQEDFVNAGKTTLEKLNEYISSCDAVIHIVGHASGAIPEPAEVEALCAELPDFVSKFDLHSELQNHGLSYTQWEAWLALYHEKPLAIYEAADIAPRERGFAADSTQQKIQSQHLKRLKKLGRDRKEFASPEDLIIEVLRAMPVLVPAFAEHVKKGEFRDRNLLFAVLAMQDQIISREAFVRICKDWADDSDQSISDLMKQAGFLSEEDRLLIEARLERRLRNRGGDVRESLAEVLESDARHTFSQAFDSAVVDSLPDRLAKLENLNTPEGDWRYRLTRTHGEGGLGVVSVAEDTTLERNVALKQLKKERVIDPMAVERFVREAKITGRLQHPNIVPVYELGLTPDDQLPFYSMVLLRSLWLNWRGLKV